MKCNVNLQNTKGPSETHIGPHWPQTTLRLCMLAAYTWVSRCSPLATANNQCSASLHTHFSSHSIDQKSTENTVSRRPKNFCWLVYFFLALFPSYPKISSKYFHTSLRNSVNIHILCNLVHRQCNRHQWSKWAPFQMFHADVHQPPMCIDTSLLLFTVQDHHQIIIISYTCLTFNLPSKFLAEVTRMS